jgi:hypothetical protein
MVLNKACKKTKLNRNMKCRGNCRMSSENNLTTTFNIT